MSAADTPKRSMRTPLGRVRNLGASHSGTSDFWRQRLTAVAMTLLMIPVLVIIMMLLGRNQPPGQQQGSDVEGDTGGAMDDGQRHRQRPAVHLHVW